MRALDLSDQTMLNTDEFYLHNPRRDWIMETIRSEYEGGFLCDIGFVGDGRASLHRSLRNIVGSGQAIGVDIGIREISNTNLSNTLAGDGRSLPFQDNSFSMVVCAEVLEHVHELSAIIVEFFRVLKPGGGLIVTTPNPYSWGMWLRHYLWPSRKVLETERGSRAFLMDADHVSFWEPLSLMNHLRNQGFEIQEFQTKNHTIPFLGRWFSQLMTMDWQFWPMDRLGGYSCIYAIKEMK